MPDFLDELVLVRELPRLVSGIDQFIIDADIKDATRASNQRRFRFKLLLDLCSQTDRPGLVASAPAILNNKFHRRLLR